MYTQEEVKQVFDGAVEYLLKGWTQFAQARGFEGIPCEADDPDATEWSLEGALTASAINSGQYITFSCGGKDIDPTMWKLCKQALKPVCGDRLDSFNDQYMLGQREVINAVLKGSDNIPSLGLAHGHDLLCHVCNEAISTPCDLDGCHETESHVHNFMCEVCDRNINGPMDDDLTD